MRLLCYQKDERYLYKDNIITDPIIRNKVGSGNQNLKFTMESLILAQDER